MQDASSTVACSNYSYFICPKLLLSFFLLFSVLVGLYEEPEKPNNALEYPFGVLGEAL